jgi:hypothetical protein
MVSSRQPRSLERHFKSGLVAYLFESPDCRWELRYCVCPVRGGGKQDFPPELRRPFRSATRLICAVADYYHTKPIPN